MHRNFNLPVGGCERSDVPHPDSIVHRVRQDMVTIRTKGQSWGECHNLQLLRSVYRCMVYPLKSPHYIMWQRMWQRVWQRMWQRMWQRVWLTCDGIDVALHLSVNFATLQIPHFNTVVNTTGDNVIWLLIETHGRHLHIIEGLLITFAVINRGGVVTQVKVWALEEAQPQEARPQEARPQEARPQEARPQEARPQEAQPRISLLYLGLWYYYIMSNWGNVGIGLKFEKLNIWEKNQI